MLDKVVFWHRNQYGDVCLIFFVGSRFEAGIDHLGWWFGGFMWYWGREGNIRGLLRRLGRL